LVPGAIADSLTSYGGIILEKPANLPPGLYQRRRSGSYGTVTEPFADPQKFPDPQVYFYQSRGFQLAESYYQSLSVPYLGLTVAEPLGPLPASRLGQNGRAPMLILSERDRAASLRGFFPHCVAARFSRSTCSSMANTSRP